MFLLDTNVLLEVRKRVPNTGVSAWFNAVPASELCLSELVVGEIRQGVERLARRDPVQSGMFERWLTQLVHVYGDRIVPVTAKVVEVWGRLNVPDPLPVVDGLLAATALVHGWTLVTRNAAEVASTGVRVLNPFTEDGGSERSDKRQVATVRRESATTAVVDVKRLRHFLASLVPSRAQVVPEAGGWSVFIPGLPVSADGTSFDEAITEMIDALREYAEDWRQRLLDAPNHRDNWGLVQLISLSDDEQLRDWLVGAAP